MIRLLLHSLLLVVAAGAGAMAMLATAEPPPSPPLIKADFPVCVRIDPGPLGPKKSGADLYPRRKDVA